MNFLTIASILVPLLTGICFAGMSAFALHTLEKGAVSYGQGYSRKTSVGFEDLFLFIPPKRIAEMAWLCAIVTAILSFLVLGGVSGGMLAILVRLGGTMAVSVYGILMFADGFIQPLLYGMCDSLQPAVGYNWGARKFSRVRAIERCCFLASAFISVLSALVLFIAPEQITRLFVPSPDPELLALAVTALQLFSITYLTRWFSFATQSYMLAVEKPLPATLISVSTALIFPVILIGVFWPLGLTGLWINMAGTSLLAALLSAVILRKLRQELHQPDTAG